MDERLNVRSENIKLLEENIGEKRHDISLSNDFLNMTPNPQTTKSKVDKWDYIKLSLHSKGNNQQSEKVINGINQIFDKVLIIQSL